MNPSSNSGVVSDIHSTSGTPRDRPTWQTECVSNIANGIDIQQARKIADLINEGVSHLEEQHYKNNADGDADKFSYKPAKSGGREMNAIQVITSAATQLAALVRPPAQVLLEMATGFTLSAALRLVVEANIPEIIRSLSPEPGTEGDAHEVGVDVSDIARLSGVEAEKLERTLRLLATHHAFVECAPSIGSSDVRFANNEISAALDSGAALEDILCNESGDKEEKKKQCWAMKYGGEASGAGLSALIGILTNESMFHMTSLTEVLLGKELQGHSPSPSSHQAYIKDFSHASSATNGEPDPDSPYRAPFSHARSLPNATMFDWLSLPQNSHRLHRFGCAMHGMNGLEKEDAILRGFDFARLPPNSTVIDVGGGVGAASLPILRANRHLRLVVQDTEEVVRVAPGFWEKHYPEALREKRVKFQEQDFFEKQPERYFDESEHETPKVFLLRMITHNWGDAACLRILKRLRAAAVACDHGTATTDSTTKLVLIDSVLMPACRSLSHSGDAMQTESMTKKNGVVADGGLEGEYKIREAPEPLLANWGVANALAYRFDLIMLSNHNAREHTLSGFEDLLSRAGWSIEAVHYNNGYDGLGEDGLKRSGGAGQSWMPQIVAVPVGTCAGVVGTRAGDGGAGDVCE